SYFILLPHHPRIHLANRRHDVIGVGFRVFRVEGDAGAAVEDGDGARAAGGAVADGFAALRLERRPGGVDGALVFDIALHGQDDRAAGRAGGDVFGFHRGDEAIAPGLVGEVQIDAGAEFAVGIG